MKSGQTLTPNIGLFGFHLKIKQLPVLGLQFEAESQKWSSMCFTFLCTTDLLTNRVATQVRTLLYYNNI